MDEYAGNARMVLGVLGHAILEPLLKKAVSTEPVLQGLLDTVVTDFAEDFVFSVNKLKALGQITDEGFVLKKGSQISKIATDSIPGRVNKIRINLIQNGSVSDLGTMLVTTEDILLSSSSYAAALVAGTSRSGPQSWRDGTGKTLKQREDELTKIAEDVLPGNFVET